VGETAAQKALSPGAYSTALVAPHKLQPGHIYKVTKSGDFREICGDDLRKQPKLVALTATAQTESADIVQDDVLLSGLQADILGFSVGPSYDRVRVTGFQEIDGTTPTGDDITQYVRANLGKNCHTVLARNKPYFIVGDVAVGKKVEELRNIGVGGNFHIPGAGVSYKSAGETVVNTRTTVVFGATGEMVKK
jgi:hypothetical protein